MEEQTTVTYTDDTDNTNTATDLHIPTVITCASQFDVDVNATDIGNVENITNPDLDESPETAFQKVIKAIEQNALSEEQLSKLAEGLGRSQSGYIYSQMDFYLRNNIKILSI